MFLDTIRTAVLVTSVLGFGDGDGAFHAILVVRTAQRRIAARLRAGVPIAFGADFGGLAPTASLAITGVIDGTRVSVITSGPRLIIGALFGWGGVLGWICVGDCGGGRRDVASAPTRRP